MDLTDGEDEDEDTAMEAEPESALGHRPSSTQEETHGEGQEDHGMDTAMARTAFPLTLAYGLTIHKSQDMTLSSAVIDLGSREFSSGLSYVALSRVRRLEDLILIPIPMPSTKPATSESPPRPPLGLAFVRSSTVSTLPL